MYLKRNLGDQSALRINVATAAEKFVHRLHENEGDLWVPRMLPVV